MLYIHSTFSFFQRSVDNWGWSRDKVQCWMIFYACLLREESQSGRQCFDRLSCFHTPFKAPLSQSHALFELSNQEYFNAEVVIWRRDYKCFIDISFYAAIYLFKISIFKLNRQFLIKIIFAQNLIYLLQVLKQKTVKFKDTNRQQQNN